MKQVRILVPDEQITKWKPHDNGEFIVFIGQFQKFDEELVRKKFPTAPKKLSFEYVNDYTEVKNGNGNIILQCYTTQVNDYREIEVFSSSDKRLLRGKVYFNNDDISEDIMNCLKRKFLSTDKDIKEDFYNNAFVDKNGKQILYWEENTPEEDEYEYPGMNM